MPTLYQITDDVLALDRLLDEAGGELTPETEAAIDAFFAEAQENVEEKLDAYCQLITRLESEAAVARSRKENFAKIQQVRENAAEHLRGQIKAFGIKTGLLTTSTTTTNEKGKEKKIPGKKITTSSGYEIGIQYSGPTFGKLELIPGQEIDEEFKMQPPPPPPVPDKEAITEYLVAGGSLPFAKLLPRTITIKIK